MKLNLSSRAWPYFSLSKQEKRFRVPRPAKSGPTKQQGGEAKSGVPGVTSYLDTILDLKAGTCICGPGMKSHDYTCMLCG
jgi:hypothetical protein